MTISLATVISNVRSELNDTDTSHLVRGEIPQGLINSTNKIYVLAYYPVTNVSQLVLTVDGAVISGAGYTLDAPKGRITLSAAPTASITLDYYFQAFTDADITVWINHGVQECGATTIGSLPDPMSAAIEKFAISMGCQAWSRKYAEGFAWTVGPETVDKKAISQNYRSLAEDNFNQGIQVRDDYYKRFGQRNAPSGGVLTWPQREYTPPR